MGLDIESCGCAIMPRGTDTTHFDDGWETLYERDMTTLPGSLSLLSDNSFVSATIDGITWSLHAAGGGTGEMRLVSGAGLRMMTRDGYRSGLPYGGMHAGIRVDSIPGHAADKALAVQVRMSSPMNGNEQVGASCWAGGGYGSPPNGRMLLSTLEGATQINPWFRHHYGDLQYSPGVVRNGPPGFVTDDHVLSIVALGPNRIAKWALWGAWDGEFPALADCVPMMASDMRLTDVNNGYTPDTNPNSYFNMGAFFGAGLVSGSYGPLRTAYLTHIRVLAR